MLVQNEKLILYAAPYSRSEIVVWALEEIGCAYELEIIDLTAGEQRRKEHLQRNSMGKVPVLSYRGQYMAETSAICCFLADLWPQARLAPEHTDPLRMLYLQWMFFASSCIEPALFLDFPEGYEPNPAQVGWGERSRVATHLRTALEHGPWILGEQFSMADVVIGSHLLFAFRIHSGMFVDEPVFVAYTERLKKREAFKQKHQVEKRMDKQLGGVPWAPQD